MTFRKTHIAAILALPAAALLMQSCDDDVSNVGESLIKGEVSITVDSIETKLAVTSVYDDNYDSRTGTKLLGRINVPEYGSLECSFVSQLLSSTGMSIADSIKVNDVDSMRMVFTVPRGALTGDSLAPQQLKVFRLTSPLPSTIDNSFDPTGYYDPSKPLGIRSYTLSALALSDSLFKLQGAISIPVRMPDKMAKDVFTAYRNNDPVFQWPSTFNNAFPGVYVEQNFGNGCIGLISSLRVYLYWHYNKMSYSQKPGTDEYEQIPVLTRDSVCLFSSQPEVLSSNRIIYKPSQYLSDLVASGKSIMTTPGGYSIDLTFPAREIIEKYDKDLYSQSVVSKLSFEIPATTVKNDFGITVAPYLLMVKTSEKEKFFRENKVPDGQTSFYASYNPSTGRYSFDGMRDYIIGLIEKGLPIDPDDTQFSLVPVNVTTEDVDGYTSTTTYVTNCTPYIGYPTMTQFDTDRALICFTFSRQEMK